MGKLQWKRHKLSALGTVLIFWISLNTSSIAKGETTSALWQGDKKGAVSITFDDGLKCQISKAYPILTQKGLKATFYIISSFITEPSGGYYMDVNDVLTLASGGQEIGSHTVTHPYLSSITHNQRVSELSQSQSALKQLTRQKVNTIAYPYGDYHNSDVMNVAENYYIAGRTVDSGILDSSSPTSSEFYRLYSGGPHDHYGSGDDNAIAGLKYWTDRAVADQKWYIETLHGIDTNYDFISSQAFAAHLDYLVANEPNLWVAPVGAVSEYIYERNAASITTLSTDSNVIRLNLSCGLDSRFNTPLTLLTDCPAGWESEDINVKQGQTSQIADVVSRNGNLYIMYDAVPDAGTIELSVGQISPPTYYTITASADLNGTISPSGSIQEAAGSNQLFTAAPNMGYAVDRWYLDGSNVQTGGTTFTLDNIQTNHTVSVTFGILPSAPASITYPISSSTGQYTVSWASSNAVTSYQLERSSNGGTTWSQVYSGANTSYQENIGNGSYRYRVKATNTLGSSGWTTGTGNCLVTAPPVPPISISYPTSSSTGQYTVKWSSSSSATSYQLERSSDSGTTWSQVYSGANTSYQESIGNGSYRYRVKATNAIGSSNWTTGTFDCMVLRPPSPPTGVSASDGTYTGKVQVSWNASSGATSYEIWRSTKKNSRFASRIAEVVSSPYDDTSVPAGTTYWYWVKAVNSIGTSDFSGGDSGKTLR